MAAAGAVRLTGMEQGIKQTHAESCARHISGSHAKPLGAIPAVSWPVAGLCSPSRAWSRDSGEGSGEPLGPWGRVGISPQGWPWPGGAADGDDAPGSPATKQHRVPQLPLRGAGREGRLCSLTPQCGQPRGWQAAWPSVSIALTPGGCWGVLGMLDGPGTAKLAGSYCTLAAGCPWAWREPFWVPAPGKGRGQSLKATAEPASKCCDCSQI